MRETFERMVEALTEEEFRELYSVVSVRQGRITTRMALNVELSRYEQQLVRDGQKIKAIKAVKDRVGCSLLIAHKAVTNFR